jgi:hypothetical protein
MAHEFTGALQQAYRVRQRCTVKEPHVYVRSEYVDVAEGRISQTCNRTAVMQKFPNFVPAFSHHLKPLARDVSQSTCMLFHPRINGGIALDSSVESQQFRFQRRSTFCFRGPPEPLRPASEWAAGASLCSRTSATLRRLSQRAPYPDTLPR